MAAALDNALPLTHLITLADTFQHLVRDATHYFLLSANATVVSHKLHGLKEVAEQQLCWLEEKIKQIDQAQEAAITEIQEETGRDSRVSVEIQLQYEQRDDLNWALWYNLVRMNCCGRFLVKPCWFATQDRYGNLGEAEQLPLREHRYPLTVMLREPQVWVHHPVNRGISIETLLDLFENECGNIAFSDSMLSSNCLPTKLTRRCNRWNQRYSAEIASGEVRLLQPNMHAVNTLLIRPATEKDRVSYSECVRGQGISNIKPIRFFMSHSWGEDFGECIQSIYHFAIHTVQQAGIASNADAIVLEAKQIMLYVCAFSNNQWNLDEELGDKIESSPFYRVLQAPTTDTVFLQLEQNASALLRAWVQFEFLCAHELGKPYIISTRYGPLQQLPLNSTHLEQWVGHLFEVLSDIDLSKGLASREDDLMVIQEKISCFKGFGVADGEAGAQALNFILKSLIAEEALTPLVKAGNIDAVALALRFRANPDSRGQWYITPLTYVIAKGGENGEIAQELLAASANPLPCAHAEQARNLLRIFESSRIGIDERKSLIQSIHADAPEFATFNRDALELATKEIDIQLCNLHLKKLEDPTPLVRVDAIRELGHTCNASTHARHIAARLDDPSNEVRRVAAEILGKMGKTGGAHVAALALCAEDSDAEVRWAAAEALMNMGEEAGMFVSAIAARLPHRDEEERRGAARLLSKIGSGGYPVAGDIAASFLSHPDWYVREAAADALGNMGESGFAHADALAKCMEDPCVDVRKVACSALAKIRESIGPHTDETFPGIGLRRVTSEVLDRLGEVKTSSGGSLSSYLDQLDDMVNTVSTESWTKMADFGATRLAGMAMHFRANPADARKGASPILIEAAKAAHADAVGSCLENRDDASRRGAVEVLGKMGEAGMVEAGTAAAARLAHRDWFVRQAAIEALARMGGIGIGYAGAVAACLKTERYSDVRAVASRTLRSMGHTSAVAAEIVV